MGEDKIYTFDVNFITNVHDNKFGIVAASQELAEKILKIHLLQFEYVSFNYIGEYIKI